ncbi:UNVERIFIED_CONTAM: hypothetical protein GTU68_030036 [Idotea baltica]|nr:hypothetical protein [Idotea baltica]
MKADPEVKIKYASKFASIANYWKKWIGESQGLEKSSAIQRKLNLEVEFNDRINESPKLRHQYSGIVDNMNQIYDSQSDLATASALHGEIFGRNIELVRILNLLDDLKNRYKNNGLEAYENRLARISPYLKNLYKNFDPRVDKYVCEKLIQIYFTQMPEAFNEKEWAANYLKSSGSGKGVGVLYRSFITDQDKVFDIIDDPEALTEALLNDPAAKFFMPLQSRFNKNVNEPYSAQKNELNELQRVYMKGLMEAFPNKRFAPDANSTMRVTYGKVKGYSPKDGVYYTPQTYLRGVMEKYMPGDYEFDVDPKLISLYQDKDYGPYGDDGKMPVCFIGTNHTTGGNSGSPVIDAEGNLIGLNFDRVWEGTMSDLNYDPEICRNIMVDARYILFIIDKFAGASHLVDEMKLVHPKAN